MKKSIAVLYLIVCAAFAQESYSPRVGERYLPGFVVVQSSGTVPPGTVLYPMRNPGGGLFSSAILATVFTNHPYCLKDNYPNPIPVTNTFNVGTTRVERVQTRYETEHSFFDGRRRYEYDAGNGVYVCGNDFVMLERTNIVNRQQIQNSVRISKVAQKFNEEERAELNRRKEVLSRCLSMTNTLTLREAEARGIDIRLREVLTIEVEQDPQYGPTSVIRRRWVLSSEPFGEKVPGLASW